MISVGVDEFFLEQKCDDVHYGIVLSCERGLETKL
jgi:hypothetical protein